MQPAERTHISLPDKQKIPPNTRPGVARIRKVTCEDQGRRLPKEKGLRVIRGIDITLAFSDRKPGSDHLS
eukprot:7438363-Pyramimonas_sp.AAC.1